MNESHTGSHYLRLSGIIQSSDECHIKLHKIQRQELEHAERGIASAEIIEFYFYTSLLTFAQDLGKSVQLLAEQAFRNLEMHTLRRNHIVLDRLEPLTQEIALQEL